MYLLYKCLYNSVMHNNVNIEYIIRYFCEQTTEKNINIDIQTFVFFIYLSLDNE